MSEVKTITWYGDLKETINKNIKQNGKREINGRKLNEVLTAMVNTLGSNMAFGGVVGPSSVIDNSDDKPVFYLALENGTYAYCGNIALQEGEMAFLYRDTNDNWHKASWQAKDGDDAYTIFKKDYEEKHPGEEAPSKTEWLASLKGEKGDNAKNPFKGNYGDNTTLPTGSFVRGDYLYAPDSDGGSTVTIWRWDEAEAKWFDSREVADMANGEVFASSEHLQEVAIDDSGLVNPTNSADNTKPVLANAVDVMKLKRKLFKVDASETKSSYEELSGFVKPDGSIGNGSTTHVVIPLGSANKVRFLGQTVGTTSANQISYAFWKNQTYSADGVVYAHQFDVRTGNDNEPKEYEIDLQYYKDKGAAYIAISITTLTRSSFYCYLGNGDTVVETIKKQPQQLLKTQFDIITESGIEKYKVDEFVIASSGNWAARSNSYSYILPVTEFQTILITRNNNLSALVAYLDNFPSAIVAGGTPNYVADTNRVFVSEYSEQTLYIPQGTKYLYIKGADSDVQTFPLSLKLSNNPEFVGRKDVSFSLEDTDKRKVMSAALGLEITPIIDAVKADDYISVLGGIRIDGYNIFNRIWKQGDRAMTIVPVGNIEKIAVIGNGSHTSWFGFLSGFPTNIENEANVTELIESVGANSNVLTEFSIPADAKYIYFNVEAGNWSYLPQKVLVTGRKDSKLEVPASFSGKSYDTYVEENIHDHLIDLTNHNKQKTYIINHDANYKVIGYLPGSQVASRYLITTYDENGVKKRELFQGGNNTTVDKKMESIEFKDDDYYAVLSYYIFKGQDDYTTKGYGALMRELKDDDWIPTNEIIYCCSKVAENVMPYNYRGGEEDAFVQGEEWSSWAFYMPYDYTRQRYYHKKFPIVADFHGSSGFVTPDAISYDSSKGYDSLQGKLRQSGFIVFDINGYGVSRQSDYNSRHWGNPRAISTAKKAYEVIVERFNGRRGMAISGISMGGAIAKSYCMTHPGDVVVAALEAPSELGCSCRFPVRNNNPDGTNQKTVAKAWGYVTQQGEPNTDAMYEDTNHQAMVGYSPCINPLSVSNDGIVKKLEQSSMTAEFIEANTDKFVCGFPVEIKIWHGYNIEDNIDSDNKVPYFYSKFFVETVRNANGNATLRTCPNCTHDLNLYSWVKQEVVDYIVSRLA